MDILLRQRSSSWGRDYTISQSTPQARTHSVISFLGDNFATVHDLNNDENTINARSHPDRVSPCITICFQFAQQYANLFCHKLTQIWLDLPGSYWFNYGCSVDMAPKYKYLKGPLAEGKKRFPIPVLRNGNNFHSQFCVTKWF